MRRERSRCFKMLMTGVALEREAALDLEIERDEQRSRAKPEPPAKKKLKRELEQEALARLESAARTVSDFENVIAWWDRLDANRERRERYHEVSRSGDDLPIDYGASEDGLRFPDTMNSWKSSASREISSTPFSIVPMQFTSL